MIAAADHPGPELLSDYALGRLDADDYFGVAEHLEQCDQCQDTLTRLELPTDTLVRGLAGPAAADPFLDEPECAAALQAIRQLDASDLTAAVPTPFPRPLASEAPHGVVRDYELLEPLGQGGMGMVYRARHMRLGRLVALKLLPAERTLQPQAVLRFHREMKAIGNLDHPHIVRASDAGEVDGRHFLVMELVEGVDLGSLAAQYGPLGVPEACELVRQAALGLDYAHRNGLVHRDVKPSNLMLDRTGAVKVLDLGLARLLEGEPCEPEQLAVEEPSAARLALAGAELTGASQALGTPDYMAPEQCRDSRSVDARTDVYGLAATLYRLLAGHAPYAGARYDTVAKKIRGLLHDPVPPLEQVRRGLPPALVALVHRSLAKAPHERPAGASELATLLEPYCRGQNVRRLVDGSPPLEPAASRAGGRYRRMLLVALGGLAAIIALGLVIARIRTPQGELTVEVPDDKARHQVSVEVRRGDRFHVLSSDPQHGWSIELDAGTWDVALKDPQQQFQLDAASVEITRQGRQVVRVTRRATPAPPAESEAPPEPPATAAEAPRPPSGAWELTLPDGFTRTATLEALDDNRYRLQTGGVLGGIYRWNGQRLVVINPYDARFNGLQWEWRDDSLLLVGEPRDLPAGQSYQGSRLKAPPAAAALAAGARVLGQLDPRTDPLPTREGASATVVGDTAAWRFTTEKTRTFPILEVASPDLDGCILSAEATLKAEKIAGRAYLELVCVQDDGSESVAHGVHDALEGDGDWTDCDALLLVDGGQRLQSVRLNLVIEGQGTALVSAARIIAKPLPQTSPLGDP